MKSGKKREESGLQQEHDKISRNNYLSGDSKAFLEKRKCGRIIQIKIAQIVECIEL